MMRRCLFCAVEMQEAVRFYHFKHRYPLQHFRESFLCAISILCVRLHPAQRLRQFQLFCCLLQLVKALTHLSQQNLNCRGLSNFVISLKWMFLFKGLAALQIFITFHSVSLQSYQQK